MSVFPTEVHDLCIRDLTTFSGATATIHGTVVIEAGGELRLENAQLRFGSHGSIVCHGHLSARKCVFTAQHPQDCLLYTSEAETVRSQIDQSSIG